MSNPKDIMFEIHITMQRDGTVRMDRYTPTETIAADKAVALGMLDIAKSMVVSELLPGPAPDPKEALK
jgi:hypothetical protein